MSLLEQLPENVADVLRSALVSEYATVSAAGVPINTPISCFPSDDFATIDLATGLSYPAKAERARKNPKVGLLIEGSRDEPVVSIAGYAAIRDSDLQANAERYIRETALYRPGNPPWEVARKAVWYWTRIIVSVTPARILWWDNRAAMEAAPHRLEAAAGSAFPPSDPTPPGATSASPKWRQDPWPDMARDALASGIPGHLTLCDAEGFPLPLRVRDITLDASGFRMDVPQGAPWALAGKATLSFAGRQIFVGDVRHDGERTVLDVERAIPMHPFVAEEDKMWDPDVEIRDAFMHRLAHETARRGKAVPVLSEIEPEPTANARRRIARAMAGYDPA